MSDPVAAAVYRTMNAGFVQEMYEQYLRDVHSVFIKGEVGLQSCAFGVSVLDAYDATDRYVVETVMSQIRTIHHYAHPSTCGHTT